MPGSNLKRLSIFPWSISGFGPRFSIVVCAADANRAEAAVCIGVPSRDAGRLRAPCRDPGRGGAEEGLVIMFKVGSARPFD